jgi:hypothetical protein
MSGLLMVLTNRLGRLVDRARELKRQERDSDQELGRDLRQELQGQKRRMGLLMKAIEFGTVTMLLVALVVAVVFISVVAKLDLVLMVAVSLLLRELQLATAQLGRSF